MSGVVQAANGTEEASLGSQLVSSVMSDSVDLEPLVVPEDSSLLRFKLLSNPPVNLTSNGILHFVTEYDNIRNLFHTAGYNGNGGPESIRLELDRIVAMPAGSANKDPGINVGISAKDRTVLLKRDRHYIPIIRNGLLPEGEYNSITVYFREPGKISFDGENEYPIYINKSSITYTKPFRVEKGRITTIHTVPVSEYSAYLARIKDKNFLKAEKEKSINSPDKRPMYRQSPRFNLEFNIQETGYVIGGRVKEIYITMKSISAVDASGNRILLNNKPTTFELMSLLDGAVVLMCHNMVPPGPYSSFELVIGDTQTVVIEDEPIPLTVEFKGQYTLHFTGPFDLRGGRISEVFLRFDPDRSVFNMENRGYILDPTIETTSVISLTTEQDLRFIEALGRRSNLVASESEIMFQGSVGQLNYVLDKNMYAKEMIYSEMALLVEDRLRGEPGDIFYLKSIGGTYNGMSLRVTGMPVFRQSDHFLIFLKKYGDRYGLVRGEWGKIDL